MDYDRFKDSPIGELVPIEIPTRDGTVDHWAFVPEPLPDSFSLQPETHLAVSEADQELGMLEGIATMLPNPQLLVRPLIRTEAVSTSALEGTYAALPEVFEAELAGPGDRAEVREVVNYLNATETALGRIEGEPVHMNMIRDLHGILFAGVRGDTPETGSVRSIPVLIGPPGARPAESHFIPPPPDRLEKLLDQWEAWNYSEDTIPIVVRTAASHYQFETIHPFRDGNGRLGRLIAVLLLIDRGPLSSHLLSLSPFLEARKAEYGERLREVSASADWDQWITFFATGVATQARVARRRVEQLLHWREETIEQIREHRLKGLVVTIAESLIGFPVLTVGSAAEQFGVTYRSANRAISRLQEIGVVAEVTGRDYGRMFVAQGVLTLISD